MVKEITRDEIERVYSGTPGCCCGCRGKYTDVSNTSRGAKATVTRILNIMNRHLADVKDEGGHLFLDLGDRWYIAYQE